MKSAISKLSIGRVLAILSICIAAFSSPAKAGGDGFEVYLNNKLVQKGYAMQKLDLQRLDLSKSNINDQLTVVFTQCNAPGKVAKGRSLVVRDDQGKILKEWKFDDSENAKPGMVIPVKDLLALENVNGEKTLSLCYQADNHPQTLVVASLKVKGKAV